jgi:hypothetical protein
VVHAFEHHDRVLTAWREEDRRGVALVHVDFHDDLRGLLVDRRRRWAHVISELQPLDPGNFLAHAVVEGRLRRVRWIHGQVGGRAWDAGIVRYESDLLAWRHRRRRKEPGHALDFEEILVEEWDGLAPGELLSVDWDCFASSLQDAGGLAARVDAFFQRLGPRVPEETWVAYSPEYVRATMDEYREFLDRLGRRFGQAVEWHSRALQEGRLRVERAPATLPRGPWMRLVLTLRRLGIYL